MWALQNLMEYYHQNNIDLFENCTTPEPIDVDLLKSYIMRRCGLLQPVYGEPLLFKMQTKMWFDSNQWRMEHLVKMLLAEYEPHENVFEYEHWVEEHSGTDLNGGNDTLQHGETHTLSGSDTLGHGETHTLSGNDTLQHGETHTLSGSDTLGYGEKHTLSGSDTLGYGEKHTLSGNDSLKHGETHTLSGNDTLGHGETHTLSGSDIDTDSTSNEHTVSAYNSSGYQADSKDQKGGTVQTTYGKKDTASGTDTTTYGKTDTASGTDTTTYGKTDTASGTDTTTYGKTDTASGTDTTTYGKTFTHGEKIEYTKNRNGNVGIKSSSDLMQEELNLLERFNVYETLSAWFEKDNMIQVY